MISQCIQQMAMKILKENPNIANNPNAQSMINVIQSGDEKKGQEIAENCDYGQILNEWIFMEDKVRKPK